jgi:Holliday junction resolvasome RuvABC endonuclease subunit
MKYIGIDPGFSGAWGMIDHNGAYMACGDMLHTGKYLMTHEIFGEIIDCLHGDDHEVVVEIVHSMPKQGVASSFKFGVAYGGAISIAQRLNCVAHMVTPQVWKKALKLDSDKNKSLSMARELWPTAPLKRQKDNGRAEALLMAYWLRKQSGID